MGSGPLQLLVDRSDDVEQKRRAALKQRVEGKEERGDELMMMINSKAKWHAEMPQDHGGWA